MLEQGEQGSKEAREHGSKGRREQGRKGAKEQSEQGSKGSKVILLMVVRTCFVTKRQGSKGAK